MRRREFTLATTVAAALTMTGGSAYARHALGRPRSPVLAAPAPAPIAPSVPTPVPAPVSPPPATVTPVSPLAGPAAVFTGRVIGSWLDATPALMEAVHTDPNSDLTGFGQMVGRWKDQSGFGNDPVQSMQYNRPTLATDAAGISHLATQVGGMVSAAGGGSSSAFYMIQALTPVSDYCALYGDSAAPNTGFRVTFNLGSGGFQIDTGNGAETRNLVLPSAKAKRILEVWYEGGTLSARLDHGAISTLAVPMVAAGTKGYVIGGGSLIYHHAHTQNHVPSAELRAKMYEYAKLKAGNQAATPALAAVAAIAYPFGARITPYLAGIKPNNVSQASMDNTCRAFYDHWKNMLVRPADFIVPGGYIVKFPNPAYLTVSEGASYGMLLTVLMAGHDPEARTIFDGLLAVARARPAYNLSPKLMEWRLNADGTGSGSGYNAFDGDEDIAMALLMAHRQWGSGGKWNYLLEGIGTINAMKQFNINSNGATKGMPQPNDSRTSDYMIGHFRAFQRATGDNFWNLVINKSYETMTYMQNVYAPNTGLLPDFVIDTNTSTPSPSPGGRVETDYREGHFFWNGCRTPWRLATDFVTTGDARSATICGKMVDFFQAESGGNPANINSGYRLDGVPLDPMSNVAFGGPACAGAMVHPRFQTYINSLWSWNAAQSGWGYYDKELQLISMIVASGNWWNP